jgi:hypothetical protein
VTCGRYRGSVDRVTPIRKSDDGRSPILNQAVQSRSDDCRVIRERGLPGKHFPDGLLDLPLREGLHRKGLDFCHTILVGIDSTTETRARDDRHTRPDGQGLAGKLDTPIISGMVWSVMTKKNRDGSSFTRERASLLLIRDVTP